MKFKEISASEFDKLETEFNRSQLVDWNDVAQKFKGKIVYEKKFIDYVTKRFKCTKPCVRRKLYAWRDDKQCTIRYTKIGNKKYAVIKFSKTLKNKTSE